VSTNKLAAKSFSRRRAASISEAQIQQACTELLLLDDWRVIHTDLKHLRGMGVQEPGMADDLFIRYLDGSTIVHQSAAAGVRFTAILKAPAAEVLWCEWKRKGGKAGDHQRNWHVLERKRGALVLVAGEDFPASIDGFREFYKASGLMRRKIIS
jgi:hypothetical protein